MDDISGPSTANSESEGTESEGDIGTAALRSRVTATGGTTDPGNATARASSPESVYKSPPTSLTTEGNTPSNRSTGPSDEEEEDSVVRSISYSPVGNLSLGPAQKSIKTPSKVQRPQDGNGSPESKIRGVEEMETVEYSELSQENLLEIARAQSNLDNVSGQDIEPKSPLQKSKRKRGKSRSVGGESPKEAGQGGQEITTKRRKHATQTSAKKPLMNPDSSPTEMEALNVEIGTTGQCQSFLSPNDARMGTEESEMVVDDVGGDRPTEELGQPPTGEVAGTGPYVQGPSASIAQQPTEALIGTIAQKSTSSKYPGLNTAGIVLMRLRSTYRKALGLPSPSHLPTKQEDLLLFQGRDSEFSPSYHSPFIALGTKFTSLEQFMVFSKCMLYEEYQLAKKTLNSTRSEEIRSIGQLLKPHDQTLWRQHCHQTALYGNQCKFDSDPKLKWNLIHSYPKTLGYADKSVYWGTASTETTPPFDPEPYMPSPDWSGEMRLAAGDTLLPALYPQGQNHPLPEVRRLWELGSIYPCMATLQRYFISEYKPVRGFNLPKIDKGDKCLMHTVVYPDLSVTVFICGLPAELRVGPIRTKLLEDVGSKKSHWLDLTESQRNDHRRKERNSAALNVLHDEGTDPLQGPTRILARGFLNPTLYSEEEKKPKGFRMINDLGFLQEELDRKDDSPDVWHPSQVHTSIEMLSFKPMVGYQHAHWPRKEDASSEDEGGEYVDERLTPAEVSATDEELEEGEVLEDDDAMAEETDYGPTPYDTEVEGDSDDDSNPDESTYVPSYPILPSRTNLNIAESRGYPPPYERMSQEERERRAQFYLDNPDTPLFGKVISLSKACTRGSGGDNLTLKAASLTTANYLAIEQEVARGVRSLCDQQNTNYRHLYLGKNGTFYGHRDMRNMVNFEKGMRCPLLTMVIRDVPKGYKEFRKNGQVIGCNAPPHTFQHRTELVAHWKAWHQEQHAGQVYCISDVGKNKTRSYTYKPCHFCSSRREAVSGHQEKQHEEWSSRPARECFRNIPVASIPKDKKTYPFTTGSLDRILLCWVNMYPYERDPRDTPSHPNKDWVVPPLNSEDWRLCKEHSCNNVGELRLKLEQMRNSTPKKSPTPVRRSSRLQSATVAEETLAIEPSGEEPMAAASEEVLEGHQPSFQRVDPTMKRPFDAGWPAWKRFFVEGSDTMKVREELLAVSEMHFLKYEIDRMEELLNGCKLDARVKKKVQLQQAGCKRDRDTIKNLYNFHENARAHYERSYDDMTPTKEVSEKAKVAQVDIKLSEHMILRHFLFLNMTRTDYKQLFLDYLAFKQQSVYPINDVFDECIKDTGELDKMVEEVKLMVDSEDNRIGRVKPNRIGDKVMPSYEEDGWKPDKVAYSTDKKISRVISNLKLLGLAIEGMSSYRTPKGERWTNAYRVLLHDKAGGNRELFGFIHMEYRDEAMKISGEGHKRPNPHGWSKATGIPAIVPTPETRQQSVEKRRTGTKTTPARPAATVTQPLLQVTSMSEPNKDVESVGDPLDYSYLNPGIETVASGPAQNPMQYDGEMARTAYRERRGANIQLDVQKFLSTDQHPNVSIASMVLPEGVTNVFQPTGDRSLGPVVPIQRMIGSVEQLPCDNTLRHEWAQQVTQHFEAMSEPDFERKVAEGMLLLQDNMGMLTGGIMSRYQHVLAKNRELVSAKVTKDKEIKDLAEELKVAKDNLRVTKDHLNRYTTEEDDIIAMLDANGLYQATSFDTCSVMEKLVKENQKSKEQLDTLDTEKHLLVRSNSVAQNKLEQLRLEMKAQKPSLSGKELYTQAVRELNQWPEDLKAEVEQTLVCKDGRGSGYRLPDKLYFPSPDGVSIVDTTDDDVEGLVQDIKNASLQWSKRKLQVLIRDRKLHGQETTPAGPN